MAILLEFVPVANASEDQLRRLGVGIARLLLEVRLRKRRHRSRRLPIKTLPMRVRALLAGRRPKADIVLGFDMRTWPWPKERLPRDASVHAIRRQIQLLAGGSPPISRDEMLRITERFIPLDAVADVIIDRTRWLELERADQLLLRSPLLRDEQITLLQTVMRAPRGQLVTADRDDAARLIALICEFLPAARIFIVAKNNRNAAAVYRRLKRRIPADRPLFLDPLKAKGTPAGIYAGTSSFFAMANPDDWDVLLFVDTEAALASHSVDKLGEMEDQLRYCLVSVNSNLGKRTSFRIEELFGRPIHEPRADRPADVQVVVIDWCGGLARETRTRGAPCGEVLAKASGEPGTGTSRARSLTAGDDYHGRLG